jgi:glycerophosphoryl diester phosphodiesterase
MALSALDRIRSDRVLLIAHRGDSKLAPENTLPAFASAARLGVDFIELDYRHTADEVPLVIHDALLDRTTDAHDQFHESKIALDGKTVAQLQTLDAGKWFSPKFAGTRLSTLSEVLADLPDACFMVERKGGSAEVCVQVLEASKAMDRVIVQAFDWDFLRDCHRLAPKLALGALGSKELTPEQVDEAKALGAVVMGWKADLLGRHDIEQIHAAGLKAWAWTVDDEQKAKQLLDDGLNGLISNRPAVMQKLLAERVRTH